MNKITEKELENIGIFDLGKYDKFLLGIDINFTKFNSIFLRPAMYECEWFFMDTDIGYTKGYANKIEGADENNASELNALFIYENEVEEIKNYIPKKEIEVIIYIAKTGQTEAVPYLLIE